MKNKAIKISFIILSIMLVIPSIIYLIQNKTILEFNMYYNFFITENISKIISTTIYLIIFTSLIAIYLTIVKKDLLKDIKEIIKYTGIISIIFFAMLPWTSSDIFYYMGVGELNSVYKQNPYYITMKEFYEQNKENIQNDTILEKGVNNVWADTTVVYGPVAQAIFTICTIISFKNVNICLMIFKILNIMVHLANCYLIYKITKKKKFAELYGLNPFILLEFIGMVHNDIIVVFFVLLSIYFLIKKKNIYLSILFLALATGIKYFTILLLPIIILYHFRKEEKLSIRFLRCVQYGVIFALFIMLEYLVYFRDYQILFAMIVQTQKYSKSIYCVTLQIDKNLTQILKTIMQLVFVIYYFRFCINLLTQKNIKFYKTMREYNIAIILFILILTTCQQWYLIWLFATIMWQKPYMIKNIIQISLITEIANSVYMYKTEWFKYDIYFYGIIIVLSLYWMILTDKNLNRKGIEENG